MTDDSFVTRVSLDMIHKYVYIDGLWTVIITQRAMLCFTWLTCVFICLSVFVALY
jgi:hypothetical protein